MLLASLLVRPAWIFAALLLGAGIALPFPSAAESARLIPPPMLDETANPQATSEVAILAGGCLWGVQGVFQHVEGVLSAVSGYAGGAANTAHYEVVSTNTTGHAEAVRVTSDPHLIIYDGSCRSIFRSLTIRQNSIVRGPMSGRNIARQFFPSIRSRHASPRPISPSSTKDTYSMPRSSPVSSPAGISIRPRIIIRIS
jgi:peptide-methionine (S)-S-oxide reductase